MFSELDYIEDGCPGCNLKPKIKINPMDLCNDCTHIFEQNIQLELQMKYNNSKIQSRNKKIRKILEIVR